MFDCRFSEQLVSCTTKTGSSEITEKGIFPSPRNKKKNQIESFPAKKKLRSKFGSRMLLRTDDDVCLQVRLKLALHFFSHDDNWGEDACTGNELRKQTIVSLKHGLNSELVIAFIESAFVLYVPSKSICDVSKLSTLNFSGRQTNSHDLFPGVASSCLSDILSLSIIQ